MRCLIVNGDDFGASDGINRGILETHRRGILTSASLMVQAPRSAEAAAMASDAPGMSLGLHFDLDSELACFPPGDSDRLRDAVGRQFARFLALVGRTPSHLDAHHNVQRDPRVLPHLLDLSLGFGIPVREHSPVRHLGDFYGQWGGESHFEQIDADHLTRLLRTRVGDGFTELGCHPGYVDRHLSSRYLHERVREIATLCDARVRDVLEERSIRLVSFDDPGLRAPGAAV